MTLLDTVNVGGTDYGYLAVTALGSCATPAGTEIKQVSFSDDFLLRAGVSIAITFTYANTYGDGSLTYPKLNIRGTNYPIKFSTGSYAGDGAWADGQTVAFMFDGTNFIAGASSGGGGASIPLGLVVPIYSNVCPSGYLPCDGTQFDTAQFPALYALLGDDHTPDLRECAVAGAGKNTTKVFDSTETDPNTGVAGTQNHDVFTLGEFKDDQVQNHRHKWQTGSASIDDGVIQFTVKKSVGWNNYTQIANGTGDTGSSIRIGGIADGNVRKGDVTRGKRVGLNYIIKATTGLDPVQQDYVLQALAEAGSYSTTEVATGKKWIDGKTIYRKVAVFNSLLTVQSNTWTSTEVSNSGIDTITSVLGINDLGANFPIAGARDQGDYITILSYRNTYITVKTLILEYTKTTPST